MIPKPKNPTTDYFVQFARDWFKEIASGNWQSAFEKLDLPTSSGEAYTPKRYRDEIENDHFCEGTVFRRQHPEGIVYSDPDTIGESKYTDLYPLRDEQLRDPDAFEDFDEELARRLQKGLSVELEHPVPLNGEWSDLTACFQFVSQGDNFAVRLEWLHVL
jgi:hypothetical protein